MPNIGTWAPPSGRPGAVGRHFEDWLHDFIGLCGAEMVIYEAPIMASHGGGAIMNFATAFVLIGLGFATEIVCEDRGIRVERAAVSSVRKHFCNSGRAKKADVIHRCRLLGYDVRNHDAADATATWHFGKSKFDPSFNGVGTPLFRAADAKVNA